MQNPTSGRSWSPYMEIEMDFIQTRWSYRYTFYCSIFRFLRKKRSTSLTVRVFLVHIRVLVSFCEGIGLLEATVIEKLRLFGLIEVVIWHVARITVIIGSITWIVGIVVIARVWVTVLIRILLITVIRQEVVFPTSVLPLLIVFLKQVVKRLVLNKLRLILLASQSARRLRSSDS